MKPMHRNRAIHASTLAVLALLAGCATVRGWWPFGHHDSQAPQPVTDLVVGLPDGAAPQPVLQYRERNTLVLDLTGVADRGRITLQPGADGNWPARIAVRMMPRRFGELEVRGAQRLVLPVAAAGSAAVTAELPPGIYAPGTAQLAVSWGASGEF
jgi:hypothetical protein